MKSQRWFLQLMKIQDFLNLFEFIQLRKDVKELAVDWHSCPVRENLIKENQRVILKGCVNKELADKLQSLFSAENSVFVNGKKEGYNNQLILLLSENLYFKSAKVFQQNYQLPDFYQQLTKIFPNEILNSWISYCCKNFYKRPRQRELIFILIT